MELTELFDKRRSVRSFCAQPIPTELLKMVVMSSQFAPSWKNSQPSRFYIANTPESIAAVRACLPDFNRKSSENASYIVTSYIPGLSGFSGDTADNELGNQWGAHDLGTQTGYLILKASDVGLDTLIMGLRDAEGLKAACGMQAEEVPMAVIAIGYRDKEPAFRGRKPLETVLKIL